MKQALAVLLVFGSVSGFAAAAKRGQSAVICTYNKKGLTDEAVDAMNKALAKERVRAFADREEIEFVNPRSGGLVIYKGVGDSVDVCVLLTQE